MLSFVKNLTIINLGGDKLIKFKKILKISIIFFIVYILSGLLIVHMAYSWLGFTTRIDYSSIKTPEEYGLVANEKDVTTSDDFKIHIYEVEANTPSGVVIMLTGITGPSVTHFYGMSELLFENNYSSILVDVRGHGKSEGNRICFGLEETKDVQAVVDYINSEEKYKDIPIIVMGTSMGGAIAVNSASLIDDIDGLISIAAFSSWTDANIDMVELKGWPRQVGIFFKPAVILYGWLSFGNDYFEYVPEKTIKNIGEKPVLFMQAVNDPEVSVNSFVRLYDAYGKDTEVWIRNNNHHFVVNSGIDNPREDEEFCNKILNFLNDNFGQK